MISVINSEVENKDQTIQKNNNSLFEPYFVYELQTGLYNRSPYLLKVMKECLHENRSLILLQHIYLFFFFFQFLNRLLAHVKSKFKNFCFCYILFSKCILYKSTTRTAFLLRKRKGCEKKEY